jgi:hypothetical protein
MRVVAILLSLAAGAITACASSQTRHATEECMLTSADSSFIAGRPLYLGCAVDEPAKPLSSRIDYSSVPRPPERPQPGVTCYAAEVKFVVGADGRPEPSTIRLIRTNDHTLGQALLQSVPGWMYSPAVLDGTPVRQLVSERRAVAVAISVTSTRGDAPVRPALPPRCR